jgi:hypothetical protein
MTRKLPAVFALSLGISFFLLLGILGKQGLLCNMSLEQELESVRYRKEMIALQVDSLKAREAEIGSIDGLRDAALRLGYRTEGDQVYYFADGEGEPLRLAVPDADPSGSRPVRFEGLPVSTIFFAALAFSLLFTIFLMIVAHRRSERNDEFGRRSGSAVSTDSWDS